MSGGFKWLIVILYGKIKPDSSFPDKLADNVEENNKLTKDIEQTHKSNEDIELNDILTDKIKIYWNNISTNVIDISV